MARPSKPVSVLKFEGKSHRTPQELKFREKQEAALLTGRKIKEAPEVRENEKAHAEFRRVIKLLEAIQKNDALYEAAINRYCILRAEEQDFLAVKSSYIKQLQEITDQITQKLENHEDGLLDLFKVQEKMQSNVVRMDTRLSEKRKELLTLEKEHAMTIAAAMRAIPKTPEKTKTALLEALGG